MTDQFKYKIIFLLFFVVVWQSPAAAQKDTKEPAPLIVEKGKLVYSKDAQGNRIPDFSYCGYKASEEAIPDVDIKIVVPITSGDATSRIQSALNYVATLPIDQKGFRGAVLLQKGTYEVFGQLHIAASGVVLRGSGAGSDGTTLIGAGKDRHTLLQIRGKQGIQLQPQSYSVADGYVPVNARSFSINAVSLPSAHSNHIIIRRPSTVAWIRTLGTEIFGGGISALGWKPGDHDIYFDRDITNISGKKIEIDAPLTTALDSAFGGGVIYFYNDERITNCGIENLRCISSYDKSNAKDEDHRWNAIDISNAKDVWVRQVNFQHFAGSAVNVLETSKRVTIEDCKSLDPISEIGGQRRYTFLTSGQQTLIQRCYAENGYHDFATGFTAPGPNAFVQCESILPYNFSGAIDSWSSGILFDVVNVDGQALRFGNRGQDGNGAGWAAANSVFWNCSAARIDCYKPPTAQNWAFGSWSQFAGDGYWAESNNAINPRSLYYAQLSQRLNKNVDAQAQVFPLSTDATSSPTAEMAAELTALAYKPQIELKSFIDAAAQRHTIPVDATDVKIIDAVGVAKINLVPTAAPMSIRNGLLVKDGAIVAGKRQGVQWWSGGLHGKDLANAKAHITRFVPGRVGKGFTDDLGEVTDEMKATNTIGIEHNYGLWYDRRRDDHERVRRMNGEVWPPFYEMPYARSGKGIAWDGLSKYDLTTFNHFYWSRLKSFAQLADQKGLLLVHQHYFQHNIIEAGAHYADFPWRTANNINNTGFPEPVPYAGDKRIFMAEQYYDISNPVRKELHAKYIRKCLDNFQGNTNVIQLIGEEFTGPTHFVKFWLDVISEWEKKNKTSQLIGLSVTKDVQDAILSDPKYAALVDIIDIRYWHYQADGTAYAPAGGQNLAPRQHARLLKPKKTSFEQVYRAVSEYKKKFPAKAIVYSGDNYPEYGMAVLMAGGSLPVLPADVDTAILKAAAGMKPAASGSKNEYILSDGKKMIIYNTSTGKIVMR